MTNAIFAYILDSRVLEMLDLPRMLRSENEKEEEEEEDGRWGGGVEGASPKLPRQGFYLQVRLRKTESF